MGKPASVRNVTGATLKAHDVAKPGAYPLQVIVCQGFAEEGFCRCYAIEPVMRE